MGFLPILFLVFIIFLVLRRRELGFLKNRYYISLGLLSLAWWAFLVIDQLGRSNFGCMSDDDMCTRGNTFWGDFTLGTILAIFSLTPVWIAAVFVGLYLKARKNRKGKNT